MSIIFYNKYTFLNNSYLSIHIVRQTYQKIKTRKILQRFYED